MSHLKRDMWWPSRILTGCVQFRSDVSVGWRQDDCSELQKRPTIWIWAQLLWTFGHFAPQQWFFVPTNCPHLRLLGGGFSTPVPLFCLIWTIDPNKTGIVDKYQNTPQVPAARSLLVAGFDTRWVPRRFLVRPSSSQNSFWDAHGSFAEQWFFSVEFERSATFSFWIHSGKFWNPTNCEKFNSDGSLSRRWWEGRILINLCGKNNVRNCDLLQSDFFARCRTVLGVLIDPLTKNSIYSN